MTTAFENDILAELRERDQEVHELRAALKRRGHQASHEATYQGLVHLEASERARVLVQGDQRLVRIWSAA